MRETWDAAARLGGSVLGAPDRAVAQLDALFARVGGDGSGSGLCVDVGCGSGRITVELAARWPEVLALDVSPAMLERTREAVAQRGLSNVRLQLVSGVALDGVDDACADVVVCYGVLQHVPSRRVIGALLAEFARTLKPDGEAFVQLPVLDPGFRARLWRLARGVQTAFAGQGGGDVYRAAAYRGTRVTDGELRRLLDRAGLRVAARADGGVTGAAETLARYGHSREVVLRLTSAGANTRSL